MVGRRFAIACLLASGCASAAAEVKKPQTCFLLHEIGVGEQVKSPAALCETRLTPASTFKIPHALAAVDAGVISGADELIAYDPKARVSNERWKRDHTLASAMRYSVLPYFQQIAKRLGIERERTYATKLDYGNHDVTGEVTTFWLGGSLRISPREQEQFLLRLHAGKLPVSPKALETVRTILVQPRGQIVNARGEHAFDAPWPDDVVVSAKPGSYTYEDGQGVRWLVGYIDRGKRSWVFVACVAGKDVGDDAAIELGATSLRAAGVL
jgi:beta-lactamase class D